MAEELISLHIKSGQNTWEVIINTNDTIETFKNEISKISNIPSINQRLIYSGKILKDNETINFYNIKDGHSVHLVKSGGASSTTNSATTTTTPSTTTTSTNNNNNNNSGMSAGQGSGFNPLNDLTSARYAGFLNLPSNDMFGPDGGSFASNSQEDMLNMLDNPIFQSQMNEMLSNPQMLDFMINSNPQLQAMGPQAREMLQSPMFRQMMTNPDMLRQSMRFAQMMNNDGESNLNGNNSAFPAPGNTNDTNTEQQQQNTSTTQSTNTNANNFMNPMFNPALLQQFLGGSAGGAAAPREVEVDNRPPEQKYEQQLRQLNDMGFFDFDKNVDALRRSGGSVQGAVNNLLNDI